MSAALCTERGGHRWVQYQEGAGPGGPRWQECGDCGATTRVHSFGERTLAEAEATLKAAYMHGEVTLAELEQRLAVLHGV